MQLDLAAVRAAAATYPKPEAFRPSYGTAGFRAEASLLPSTVFRCGMLIGLKARSCGQVRLTAAGAASCAVH
jgi:phosphoacetylglucosamine mutase